MPGQRHWTGLRCWVLARPGELLLNFPLCSNYEQIMRDMLTGQAPDPGSGGMSWALLPAALYLTKLHIAACQLLSAKFIQLITAKLVDDNGPAASIQSNDP